MKRYIGPSLLLVAVITLVVWVFSQFVEPRLPSNIGGSLVLLFVALTATAGAISSFKDVVELVHILSDRTRNEPYAIKNLIIQPQNVTFIDSEKSEVDKRIAQTVRHMPRNALNEQADVLYRPPRVPDRIAYIFAARHDIERKIMRIVLQWGGHWAGHSMAGFSIYFDLARTHQLISQELAQQVNDFYYLTQILLNQSNVESDRQFLEVQYLAFDIDRQLQRVLVSHTARQE